MGLSADNYTLKTPEKSLALLALNVLLLIAMARNSCKRSVLHRSNSRPVIAALMVHSGTHCTSGLLKLSGVKARVAARARASPH